MIIQKYLTLTNYKKSLLKKNKWISVHYTANNGDTAWGNCNYFYVAYRGASANYFVDETSCWQCVEDNDVAWAVGANKYYNGCRNTNSISVELCSRKGKDGKFYFLPETVKNAKELIKHLMKKYDIDIDHVVRHKDVTGKWCPAPWCDDEEAWLKFKEEIEVELEMEKYGYKVYNEFDEIPSWAKDSITKSINAGILKGTGDGLGLTLTEIKTIVWLDRCGLFDKFE